MAYPNIEKFDEIVGKTFARLYVKFPCPIVLKMDFFVGEKGVFNEPSTSGFTLPTEQAEFAFSCVKWLVESGYISASKEDLSGMTFGGVVLTAKGLEVLKQTPSSLKTSLGEQLISAVETGSIDAVRSVTSQSLTLGLSVLWGALMPGAQG